MASCLAPSPGGMLRAGTAAFSPPPPGVPLPGSPQERVGLLHALSGELWETSWLGTVFLKVEREGNEGAKGS